jgi:hypothetical protein
MWGSSCSGLVICSCCQYQLFQFSTDPVFLLHPEEFWPWCITFGVTGFWASSGIPNTRKHNVSGEGKTEKQLDSLSETLCFIVFRIPDNG